MSSPGRRRAARVAALGLVAAGLLTMPSASGQQQDNRFPNLPLRLAEVKPPGVPINTQSLASSRTSTLTYIDAARQWIQAPSLLVTADNLQFPNQGSPAVLETCRQVFGASSERCVARTVEGRNQKFGVLAFAYPVGFEGTDPAFPSTGPAPVPIGPNQRRFGATFTDFPAQPIRLIAFGTLPVEAQLHLSLPVDAGGLPIPIRIDGDNWFGTGLSFLLSDSVGSGGLVVRISDVRVDGVPLAVGDACRTAEPARLRLRGVGFAAEPGVPADFVPPGNYNPLFGGQLNGTATIGAFSGCGSVNEDLDPLVNALAGNLTAPLRIQQARVSSCFNDNPRLAVNTATCNDPGVLAYPAGTELPTSLPPFRLPAPPQDRGPLLTTGDPAYDIR